MATYTFKCSSESKNAASELMLVASKLAKTVKDVGPYNGFRLQGIEQKKDGYEMTFSAQITLEQMASVIENVFSCYDEEYQWKEIWESLNLESEFTGEKVRKHWDFRPKAIKSAVSMTGTDLKEYLDQRGVSQRELARRLRCNAATVFRWCKGDTQITAMNEIAIRCVVEHQAKSSSADSDTRD